MSKYFTKNNVLVKRRERLLVKARTLSIHIRNFKEELDIELEDMREMLSAINQDIEDIDMVVAKKQSLGHYTKTQPKLM